MRSKDIQTATTLEAFSALTVDDLKPLAALVGSPPGRKGELVDALLRVITNPQRLRALYAELGPVFQNAIQEATHDPEGILRIERFRAKYGLVPSFGGSGRRYGKGEPPSMLRLFFATYNVLPIDLRAILKDFVPEPPPLEVQAIDELPPRIPRLHFNRGLYTPQPNPEEVELTVRHTAAAALHDVKAVLRLIDSGAVRVGEKTRQPGQAVIEAIAGVLAEGDFYSLADQARYAEDPASDLRIQGFAWPMLLQAAGLAAAGGTRLQLTAAGRKATTRPAHEVIRQVWEKWLKTPLVDEFNRISVIKGQKSKGRGLTAVSPRRQAVVEVLEECPAGRWIAVGEMFRLLKALPAEFSITHDPWKLYIAELQYGSFGNGSRYIWEMLQGRFALAFLFEYAATLGLLDVAYISPVSARNDYRSHWGTDDYSCLSRYDGLMYLRINALGAWCLGLAEHYEPAAVPIERRFRVLPNHDIVADGRPLVPSDVLLLERFAERTSEAVWRLEAGKILEAVEKGLKLSELREFLAAKSAEPLPQTVEVFLTDLAAKTDQLADLGAARLIACADAHVAQLIAHDRRLKNLCQLAGQRQLVFRASDETAVRRALRDLGYVLPPPA